MPTSLIAYITAFFTMLVIDAGWLTLMVPRLYRTKIGHLLADGMSLPPAIFFYILYILGVTVLVVMPAVRHETTLGMVFIYGALFGLVAYGTYDLTNQATLKNWPWSLTVIDLIWGTLLTGVVSLITVMLTRYFTN
jgi:uncharacterized membrane protein